MGAAITNRLWNLGFGFGMLGVAALLGATLAALQRKSEARPEETVMERYEKPDAADLKRRLTPLQYSVTQDGGTEPPFRNAYWDEKRAGIYVDVVSGEPLFSSIDKLDSGTGWPSFTRPIEPGHIETRSDHELGTTRTEVRSRLAGSHLGHLFDDGPLPTGLRYCINSAALRFVEAERLASEGYGRFSSLFSKDRAAPLQSSDERHRALATLAAGCFWGVEELLRKLPGVIETTVGYTGGNTTSPTYEQVVTGRTGHAEAVRVVYDPTKLSYEQILRYFFRLHDPTTRDRQGHDVGTQYRSAIFVHDEEQRRIAEQVRGEVGASAKWKAPVVTEIVPAKAFYPAESYHQDYLQKYPNGYNCHYLRD